MTPLDAYEKRLARNWLLLVVLTLLSVEGLGRLGGGATLAVAILGIAFIKVRIIVLDFMEVRGAPVALRAILEAWIVAVCAMLLAIAVGMLRAA